MDYPFALRDGRYLVYRSRLPARVQLVLGDLVRLSVLAGETRALIDELRAENAHPALISTEDRLLQSYERLLDLHVGRLWTLQGESPPPGVRWSQLKIIEEETGTSAQAGA